MVINVVIHGAGEIKLLCFLHKLVVKHVSRENDPEAGDTAHGVSSNPAGTEIGVFYHSQTLLAPSSPCLLSSLDLIDHTCRQHLTTYSYPLRIAMYSNSNSFLGGGNSSRTGVPQYSQPSFSNAPQGQQQPNSFAQQPTGFNAGQNQHKFAVYPGQGPQTGFQASQSQPQYTGFPQQTQQQGQSQVIQQQPYQTGPSSQPVVAPQQTGQTSSQIAQSFQSTPTTTPLPQTSTTSKIPKIRLSFLTAQDQAKFEQLFKSAVGNEQSLDGKKLYLSS